MGFGKFGCDVGEGGPTSAWMDVNRPAAERDIMPPPTLHDAGHYHGPRFWKETVASEGRAGYGTGL